MVVVEAGILCWLVCWVRGDDQHFGELNTYSGYTPPRNYRVVYQNMGMSRISVRLVYTPPEIIGLYTSCKPKRWNRHGIHHPEIAGSYTRDKGALFCRRVIHHPEITGCYTTTLKRLQEAQRR